ncbi:MAG TPA: NPCBM/NEW2 domain-containing protein [Draconibacterium sp.]|jgi:alpha-galactosidase|nr:NPCBM/NEW2 domain-containing protein [Draconibacterium sp.]
MRSIIHFFQLLFILFFVSCTRNTQTVWLDDLKIKTFSEGVSSVEARKSVPGDSVSVAGVSFDRGIIVPATSVISFQLSGNALKFVASVGVDDKSVRNKPVKFYVLGDRKILYESPEMKAGDLPQKIELNLNGIKRLGLLETGQKIEHNGTRGFWANARFEMLENTLPEQIPNSGEKYILTPKPVKEPKINSAKVFGATPGNPFLYTIAASGERPMQFSAENLPEGLALDTTTGIIIGKVTKRGSYQVTLHAENKFGKASKNLKIVIGDTIALTPAIGWNGWNSWARNIDQEKVIASANAMIDMGLINHGWTYINIDDAWQGKRGGKYNAIQPNEKFPDFKGMIDQIHSKGLKTGIYSTPWITSYAGYCGGSSDFEDGAFPDSLVTNKRAHRRVGKYSFEENDAWQFAEWGIDYLKYDWRIELSSAERMSAALKKSGRDILYSLSNSAPFDFAADWGRVANVWRTGPDIRDSWLSLYISAFTIDKWAPFAGPGHWNDPDMLIVGNVTTGTDLHPTRLTPDEQYSHVSLFSLLSAPLLIGCPIEQLDDFTLGLLTNDEVIEINQDPLGKPGRLVAEKNGIQTWVKPLEDGSVAVGLFNTANYGETPQSFFRWGDESSTPFTFEFSKVGMNGKWKLRDVWRQKDLGEFEQEFQTEIPHHGVILLKMYPLK